MSVYVNFPPFFSQTFFDGSLPASGGQIYAWVSGTAQSVPAIIYADPQGTTPISQPLILDVTGTCTFYLDQSVVYDFVLLRSSGSTIRTWDNVVATNTSNSGVHGLNGNVWSCTSTNSLSITLGSTPTFNLIPPSGYSFSNLGWSIGEYMSIANSSSSYMAGIVTAFNQTTGQVSVMITAIMGSGSYSAWAISLSGAPGVSNIISATTPLSISSGTISISQASTSSNGYLSSTDWNTFNNKISSFTSLGDGSQPAPSLAFSSNLTNGIYKFGTNILGISQALNIYGTVTIQSSGYALLVYPDAKITSSVNSSTSPFFAIDPIYAYISSSSGNSFARISSSEVFNLQTFNSNSVIQWSGIYGYLYNAGPLYLNSGYGASGGANITMGTGINAPIQYNSSGTGGHTFNLPITISAADASTTSLYLPNNSQIRPITDGQNLTITNGTNPSSYNSDLILAGGYVTINTGDNSSTPYGKLYLSNGSGYYIIYNQGNLSISGNITQLNNFTPSTNVSRSSVILTSTAVLQAGTYALTVDPTLGASINTSLSISSTLKIGSVPTGTQTYLLAVDSSGNVIQGASSGSVTGSGTAAYIPKWSSSSALTNSSLQDNGTLVSTSTAFSVSNPTAMTTTGTTLLNVQGTWNSSSAISNPLVLINATDTASAAGSYLIDVRISGSSAFNIQTNYLNATNGSYTNVNIAGNLYVSGNSTTYSNGVITGVEQLTGTTDITLGTMASGVLQVSGGSSFAKQIQVGGIASFADGAQSSPSIAFASNSTNGIYKFGTNTLGISQNLFVYGTTTLSGITTISTSTSANSNPLILQNNNTSGISIQNIGLTLQAYNGSSVANIGGLFSTSNTWTNDNIGANATGLYGYGSGGLSLVAYASSGAMNFYTGGSASGNLRGSISSAGAWSINNALNVASSVSIGNSSTAGLIEVYDGHAYGVTIQGASTRTINFQASGSTNDFFSNFVNSGGGSYHISANGSVSSTYGTSNLVLSNVTNSATYGAHISSGSAGGRVILENQGGTTGVSRVFDISNISNQINLRWLADNASSVISTPATISSSGLWTFNNGITTTGATTTFAAATTSYASLVITSGTAPTSVTSGMMWQDGTNLNFATATTTRVVADLGSAQTFNSVKTFSSVPVFSSSATISGTTAAATKGNLSQNSSFGIQEVAGAAATSAVRLLSSGSIFKSATSTSLVVGSATALSTTAAYGDNTIDAGYLVAGTLVQVDIALSITTATTANTLVVVTINSTSITLTIPTLAIGTYIATFEACATSATNLLCSWFFTGSSAATHSGGNIAIVASTAYAVTSSVNLGTSGVGSAYMSQIRIW